jgi:hypothetical protein
MYRRLRLRRVAVLGLSGVLAAFGFAGVTQAGGKKHPRTKTVTVTCELALVATIQPPIPKAENFGTITCGKPLGDGLEHDTSTGVPGSFSGPIEQFFKQGSLVGTTAISYTRDATTGLISYAGTITITDGTGRYRGATGTATVTGTSTDAVRTSLTETLTLTLKKPMHRNRSRR